MGHHTETTGEAKAAGARERRLGPDGRRDGASTRPGALAGIGLLAFLGLAIAGGIWLASRPRPTVTGAPSPAAISSSDALSSTPLRGRDGAVDSAAERNAPAASPETREGVVSRSPQPGPAVADAAVTPSLARPAGPSVFSRLFRAVKGQPSGGVSSSGNGGEEETSGNKAHVSGHVRDQHGNPVVGFTVDLRIDTSDSGGGRQSEGRVAVTTHEGAYTFSDVSPGAGQLTVRIPYESDYAVPDPIRLALRPGTLRRNLDFVLFSGDRLEGIVTNEDGDPVEGADVRGHVNAAAGRRFAATTDADGAYALGGIPEDQPIDYLVVQHPDYEAQQRTKIFVIDGDQDFILKRLVGFQVVVVGQADQTPVEWFRYRLTVNDGNGFRPARATGDTQVHDPAGRLTLTSLQNGRYRIEVDEWSPEGTATGRRGAAEFEGARDNPNREVVVEVAGGRTLRGRVALEGTGETVADVRVAVQAPADTSPWRTRLGWGAAAATVGTTSDAKGAFVLEGVAPGLQHIVAEKKGYQLRNRVEVQVPADRDPDGIEISLARASTLFGRLIGFDGDPMAGVRLMHFDGQQYWGSAPDFAATDADGRYRIEGLLGENHKLSFSDSASGLSDERLVTLKPGEEREVNFDYTGKVELAGGIWVNGNPWGGSPRMSIRPARPQTGSIVEQAFGTGFLPVESGGRYRIFLKPGRHHLVVQVSLERNFLADVFDVAEAPYLQIRDFECHLVDADVAVSVPEGKVFQPGTFVFDRRVGDTVQDSVFNLESSSELRRTVNLLAGEYRVHYVSSETHDSGVSEWTAIGPGRENVIVVFSGRETTRRVGPWSPATIALDYKTLSWDITPHIAGAGLHEAIFDYEDGVCSVQIAWVAILENGSEIARDSHEGWSGYRKIDHVYRLNLPRATPGSQYSLQASLRGHGGTQSFGTVYLRLPPAAEGQTP